MRQPSIALLLALLFVSPAHAAEKSPDWALSTTDGQTVRLSEAVQQRPVIVLFWASWCPYCKALMPHLQSVHFEYGDAVDILAVVIRDEEGDPQGYVDRFGFDFTVLLDGDRVAELYGIYATPGLLMIDSDRNIRWDLYKLEPPELPADVQEARHFLQAAYRAPYWASEIRRALDGVLK